MSVQVSYKKQTLFFLLLFVIILIIIESGARIYESQPSYNVCNLLGKDASNKTEMSLQKQICSDLKSIIYEKKLINKLKPNQHFETVNINSHGFRGLETIKEKPENIFRIFIVGGSTAAGFGSTSDETTISGFLEKKINSIHTEINVEVINAGIGGATSFSELEYVKNDLVGFEPNLIIIYDGANDARYKLLENTSSTKLNIALLQAFKSFLREQEVYRTPLVLHSFLLKNSITDYYAYKLLSDEDSNQIITLWVERISNVCELGHENKFLTMVALQPMVGSGKKILYGDEQNYMPKNNNQIGSIKILKGMSEKLPMLDKKCDIVADLRGVFDDIIEPIYLDDVHVIDLGNKIIAENIYEKILPTILKDIQKLS